MIKNPALFEITTVLETGDKSIIAAAIYLLDRNGIFNEAKEEGTDGSAKFYQLRVLTEDGDRVKEIFHEIQYLLDFDKGVGTYLKVVRHRDPNNPDNHLVLYLRPGDRFLFAGYWKGYEASSAAGYWSRNKAEFRLVGKGQVQTDCIDANFDSRPFARVFRAEVEIYSPALVASETLEGWSLLGWRGSYNYVGTSTIIDPDGCWLPKSLSVVDEWIEDALKK